MKLNLIDESTVEYETVPEGIRRTASTERAPAQRETFVLPGVKGLGWRVGPAPGQEVSMLLGRMVRQGDHDEVVQTPFAIRARQGRDRRLRGGS